MTPFNHDLDCVFSIDSKKTDQLISNGYFLIDDNLSGSSFMRAEAAYRLSFGLRQKNKRFVVRGTEVSPHLCFVIACLSGLLPHTSRTQESVSRALQAADLLYGSGIYRVTEDREEIDKLTRQGYYVIQDDPTAPGYQSMESTLDMLGKRSMDRRFLVVGKEVSKNAFMIILILSGLVSQMSRVQKEQ